VEAGVAREICLNESLIIDGLEKRENAGNAQKEATRRPAKATCQLLDLLLVDVVDTASQCRDGSRGQHQIYLMSISRLKVGRLCAAAEWAT
jgi:hypothetical protein